MTSRLKMTVATPGGSILLKFSQLVAKNYKQEVTKFGTHSLSGFRVAADTLVVLDKNPVIGSRVKLAYNNSCLQFSTGMAWGGTIIRVGIE